MTTKLQNYFFELKVVERKQKYQNVENLQILNNHYILIKISRLMHYLPPQGEKNDNKITILFVLKRFHSTLIS